MIKRYYSRFHGRAVLIILSFLEGKVNRPLKKGENNSIICPDENLIKERDIKNEHVTHY